MAEPLTLTKEQVSAMLGIDPTTFDRHEGALLLQGFPSRLPGLGKTVRYARRPVIEWIETAGQGRTDPEARELATLNDRARIIAAGLS